MVIANFKSHHVVVVHSVVVTMATVHVTMVSVHVTKATVHSVVVTMVTVHVTKATVRVTKATVHVTMVTVHGGDELQQRLAADPFVVAPAAPHQFAPRRRRPPSPVVARRAGAVVDVQTPSN